MESAYSIANAEIEKIRRDNAELLRKREAEVREKAPEFAEVEAELSRCGVALSRCFIDGGIDLEAIKNSIRTARAKKAKILKGLGLPENYLDEIFSCKKCRDTGFDENGHRCECLKKLISKNIYTNSNLTGIMRQQTFNNFDLKLFENQPDINGHSVDEIIQRAMKKAISFSENFEATKQNIYMYGDAGTGKTYMSSCIANRALERGFTVYYQSAFKMLDALEKLKFGRYDGDEQAQAEYTVKYIYDVDLLIIDDVGTEFVTAYSAAALFDIINSRLTEEKSTVISSNLSPTKITDLYGTRLASRIMGSYEPMRFVGRDLRRMKKD